MMHIPKQRRGKKIKRKSNHVKGRLVQRTRGADFKELQAAVALGQFEYLLRQTCSRSLCRAYVSGQVVHFIIARPHNVVLTVLTEDQAGKHLEGTQYDNS